MTTKWEMMEKLYNELRDELPEIAFEIDVDIWEARADKCSDKRYDAFRKKCEETFE